MWLVEQTTLQPPQLLTSVEATAVSQPSDCLLPLQSANPAAQVPLQVLLAHVTVAMWLDEQATPQPPQLVVLDAVLVSHPSVCLLLLQSAKPAAQVPLQVPGAVQVGVG